MKRNPLLILAPHADDEIIGCFSFLQSEAAKFVFFYTEKDVDDSIHSRHYFKFQPYLFQNFKPMLEKLGEDCLIMCPDPIYEQHPLHRKMGHVGESLVRLGYDVVFYSTNMNAPYISEVKEFVLKKECLDTFYPAKASLWQYDHRYFLFEGYNKWIIV